MGEGRGLCRIFVENVREIPLGRPRSRLKHNIKMDLQKLGCEGIDWIELA
jgi:hypothetical protein